jgi:hypothetical protein
VEDGVRELLKARRVLCGSYVYGYYLEDNGYNKTIFEFMQVILHVSLVLFQITAGSSQVLRDGSVTQHFFLRNKKYKYKISSYIFHLILAIFRPVKYLCIGERSVTEQGPS